FQKEHPAILQVLPSAAADCEEPTEGSPKTDTLEPPSAAAVSPGREEHVGNTKEIK
uniref:Uncharacterized protein n=1 Tax=Rhinolophus ferrumequinum TaxID=59479 RepID=A0A671EDA9_RHIFE